MSQALGADLNASPRPAPVGLTSRRDAWWLSPLVVGAALSAFVVYSIWAALSGVHYRFGPYLSPLYSPDLFGDAQSWLGVERPGWWPRWFIWSPALLALWAPAGLRVTCYYYRGAYYKALWADPPACAVGEPRAGYRGENSFPLVLQNVHRYFMYLGVLYLVFLGHDLWDSFWFADPAGGEVNFGIGVGTFVLAVNLVLLAGYTFGCHSLRHLVGGGRDRISECPTRLRLYECATMFNRGHMSWAWASLCVVAFADFYVRMCAAGVWTDFRIL